MKKSSYQVPFDKDGNQLAYPDYGHAMRDNFEFEDTLKYVSFGRGRSAVHVYFERASNGKRVNVFMTDLHDMMAHLDHGSVKGKFTFQKRGMNYGCKLIPY